MKEYLAEMHVHTVLSPCGDLLMTPLNILENAKKRGIEILAITDHNSAENMSIMLQLAEDYNIHIFPGMEVETREEVHLVTIFDTLDQVLAMQEIVYNHLPPIENDEDYFGPQLLTDINDDYIDRVNRLLVISTSLSIEETVAEVEKLGGLVYPAHVDRQRNSILTQLGFIPPDLEFTALEVTPRYFKNNESHPFLEGYSLIPAADAHFLKDLLGSVIFRMEEPTVAELKKALLKENGRNFYWRED
ncbi:MAG: PHP domain-containing protein [Halanaerobiales bacterium]|nr:PHP domain-containing protein [Halanaerobiales bacterium]